MVKIVWTEQSVFDLKDIFDYISKDSRRYAEDQIRRIKSKTVILSYLQYVFFDDTFLLCAVEMPCKILKIKMLTIFKTSQIGNFIDA